MRVEILRIISFSCFYTFQHLCFKRELGFVCSEIHMQYGDYRSCKTF